MTQNKDLNENINETLNNSHEQKEESPNAVPQVNSTEAIPSEEVFEEAKTTFSSVANEENASIQVEKARGSRKKKWISNSWVKTISAGVIGSVITLSIIPFTDYPDMFNSSSVSVSNESSKSEESSFERANTSGDVKVESTKAGTTELADMIEEVLPAIVGVVNVQTQTSHYYGPYSQQQNSGDSIDSGTGSGVIFKVEGDHAFIVTNYHVIEGAEQIEISLDSGERTTAELIGGDALTDLAVLSIDSSYASVAAEFGDSSSLRAGEEVIAIGNPLGLDFSGTVTQGIVSAVDRDVAVTTSAGEWEMSVIQTDAAINPGNSGGALLNTAGQVIGINSLKISDEDVEGLGFAIPSNDLVPIINKIIETGKVERVYLGVSLVSLDEIPRMYLDRMNLDLQKGVLISSIEEGSTADVAGLQAQDVIVEINDAEITDATELRKYLYGELNVGDQATITFYRNGEKKSVTVTLRSNSSETVN